MLKGRLILLIFFFLLIRFLVIVAYKDTYYNYGMVLGQFAIAEAAYQGYWFSQDELLVSAVQADANNKLKYIPLEELKNYPRSGQYTTYFAQDVPGLGYLIALTSKITGSELTTRYALIIQILLELVSILLFLYCISLLMSEKIAFLAGIVYIFGYPFIWPMAAHPMRDIFVMGVYSFYLTALTIFSQRRDFYTYLVITALIILSALLLWIRPSAYYLFFLVSSLVFFLKGVKISHGILFVLISVFVPIMIFGFPFRQFNLRYYGMANTDYFGRALWEGMGAIENNQYGFVCDDGAIVPWAESRGYNYYYGSPELNKLLGSYARNIIKKDPWFCFQTVKKKFTQIKNNPLGIISTTGLPVKGLFYRYGKIFFHVGIFLSILMIVSLPAKRILLLVLLAPLFYSLLIELAFHVEWRYLVTGAWVLILPFAWFIDKLIFLIKRKFFKCVA